MRILHRECAVKKRSNLKIQAKTLQTLLQTLLQTTRMHALRLHYDARQIYVLHILHSARGSALLL